MSNVETILEQTESEKQLNSALDRNLDNLFVKYPGGLNVDEASDPIRAADRPSWADRPIVDWPVICLPLYMEAIVCRSCSRC